MRCARHLPRAEIPGHVPCHPADAVSALGFGLVLLTNAPDARADERLIEQTYAAVQLPAAAYFARAACADACGPLSAPAGL